MIDTVEELAAEEWLGEREVLVQIPYTRQSICAAIVSEQRAAFLAGVEWQKTQGHQMCAELWEWIRDIESCFKTRHDNCPHADLADWWTEEMLQKLQSLVGEKK